MNTSTVFCVLGMHRSGTSMLMRLLNIAGVYVGEEHELMESADSNPLGHWEHLEVYEINCALLELFGGNWKQPPSFPDDWLERPEVQNLKERARSFTQKMQSASQVWGFKEPRTCLTLPFWKEMIPEMHYVIALRNPFSITDSLKARDNIELYHGLYLWARYWGDIVAHTAGEEHCFVLYDELVQQPLDQVRRIFDTFQVDAVHIDTEKSDAISSFVRPDLLHHHSEEKMALSSHWAQLQDTQVLNKMMAKDFETTIYAMYADARSMITSQLHSINQLTDSVQQKDAHIQHIESAFASQENTIRLLKEKIQKQDHEIRTMRDSHFWKLRNRYVRLKNNLLRWKH